MNPPQKQFKRNSRTASCIVAALFLISIILIFLILFFSVLKAKEPTIQVKAVEVTSMRPDLSASMINNLSMSLFFSVHNPNRAAFDFYYSNVQLLYYGRQIAFIFVPAGKIGARKNETAYATLVAQPFAFLAVPLEQGNNSSLNVAVQVESRIRMAGRVSVASLFTHHVEARSDCRNNIGLDGTISSFQCSA